MRTTSVMLCSLLTVACGNNGVTAPSVAPSVTPITVPTSTIALIPALPSITMTVQAQAYAGDTVTFTATPNAPAGVDHLTWAFGDASAVLVAGNTVSHVYSKAGRYATSVSVTDARGMQDASPLQYILVLDAQVTPAPYVPPVVPVVTPPAISVMTLDNVTTTAGASNAIIAKVVGAAQTVLYTWAFGDGMTLLSDGPSVSHTWLFTGTYVISVASTDTYGRVVTASAAVTVH